MIKKEDQHETIVLESYEGCRAAMMSLLESGGFSVQAFDDSKACVDAISCRDMTCKIIIMGSTTSPMRGPEVISQIGATRPSLPIIVLTSSENSSHAVHALKQGVYDYIEKPAKGSRLSSTVQNEISGSSGKEVPAKSLLSKAEYEVLMYIMDGKSTKEISEARHRSVRTIEDQRSAIMKKLQVNNLVDLVKRVAHVVMPA